MNLLERFARACQSVSDRLRLRRERIEQFRLLAAARVARMHPFDQGEIETAHAAGRLLNRLEHEKTAIKALLAGVDKEVGGVPLHQHQLALHELMRSRLEGLDLHGWRWSDLNFSKKPFVKRIVQRGSMGVLSNESRPEPQPQYMENATGRIMDENEFVAKGGLVRPLKFTRIK